MWKYCLLNECFLIPILKTLAYPESSLTSQKHIQSYSDLLVVGVNRRNAEHAKIRADPNQATRNQ